MRWWFFMVLLATIRTAKELFSHPKPGASWEGFVLEQVLSAEPHDDAYFWATHQGAEIDPVLRRGARLWGVECKRTDTPQLTPSIRIARADLALERVAVIYPGTKRYPLTEDVEPFPSRRWQMAKPSSPMRTPYRPILPEKALENARWPSRACSVARSGVGRERAAPDRAEAPY
jgi:hypothetical protein